MQPDEQMTRTLFERAHSACECRLSLCPHGSQRCREPLSWGEHQQAWHLFNMNLTEDPADHTNWLVLCTECLQQWPVTSPADQPDLALVMA